MKRIFFLLSLLLALASLQAGQRPWTDIRQPGGKDGRPSGLPQTYLSTAGHFLLHYTNTGLDSVPQIRTLDGTVPDFILHAGTYLEHAYSLLVDTLGYSAPPVDNASSPETDVYFRNLGDGGYGGTTPEAGVASTSRTVDYTSYIEIDNDFVGALFYRHGDDALRVTCAHEFFHVVQLGYGLWSWSNDEVWFLEASSVWFEDKAFPEVNDYFQYFERYSTTWGDPVPSYSYDNAWFTIYLEALHPNSLLDIWTAIMKQNVYKSVTNYLVHNFGSDGWSPALADMAASLSVCGQDDAAVLSPIPDAAQLPALQIPKAYTLKVQMTDSLSFSLQSKALATNFFNLSFPSGQQRMEVGLDGTDNLNAEIVYHGPKGPECLDISSGMTYLPSGLLNGGAVLCIGGGVGNGQDLLTARLVFHQSSIRFAALFPNPVMSGAVLTLSISFPGLKSRYLYRIYNILGQRLYDSGYHVSSIDNISVPLATTLGPVASGVYFMELSVEDETFVKKFTILK